MIHKIVYNNCYGGFTLSISAIEWLEHNCTDEELQSFIKQALLQNNTRAIIYTVTDWFEGKRHHKDLVSVVEALGDKASGDCAKLSIATIEGDLYNIDEYDGWESVVTPDGLNWIIIEDERLKELRG